MAETHYSISEAARLVGVESHVLRYWEDELELVIPRNAREHRYYTDLHIRLLTRVKELKEKGYQLRAIEQVMKKMMEGDENVDPEKLLKQNAVNILKEGGTQQERTERTDLETVKCREAAVISGEKLEQFQQLMNLVIGNAVGQAIQENNHALIEEISRQVNDRMVQELEYMMRISDEREEERFRMLDEALRAYQKEGKSKAEAAAARLPFFRKKKFGKNAKKAGQGLG